MSLAVGCVTNKNGNNIHPSNIQSMMFANTWVRYSLKVVFVCLYITLSDKHHYANLSVGTEDIIWLIARYILWKLGLRLSQFWLIFCAIYRTVRFLLTHLFCDVFEHIRTYHIIIFKSEVRNINHCLGLRCDKMVCPQCLAMFWWRMQVMDPDKTK